MRGDNVTTHGRRGHWTRARRGGQLLGLLLAAVLTAATSAGEANDDESTPGGIDPGGEQNIGDDEVDFSEVETPTEVVLGGNDFLLTADGRYILAVRALWYGGGDEETELRDRKLFALDTAYGGVTSGLDLKDSNDFGVVLLQDPQQIVVVHRTASGNISHLEGVHLPDFAVQWTYTPPTPANAVRLSPSGRFLALWETQDFIFYNSDVDQLTVMVHDRQTGQTATFSGTDALADVVAEPDSSAFYIALSEWRRDNIETSTLRIIRVDLTMGLPFQDLTIPAAGHASDLEIKGGSSLRLNPDSRTLVFAGCTFVPGTCNARMYVVDADTVTLRGDLRGAGAAVFDPTSDQALGWDGHSSDAGKIWITDCQAPNLDPADPYYVDHWLLSFDTETLDSSIVELPQLAPYYYMTRDGAYTVVSVENCDAHQLFAVDNDTGEATAVEYADHALHHFTVLDDHRSIYSVDRGLLERIDLNTLAATPTGFGHYVSRINRMPASPRLVLADPDLLTFYVFDTSTDTILATQSIDYTPSPPPPPGMIPGASPGATPGATPAERQRSLRASILARPLDQRLHGTRPRGRAPRMARPRLAGGRLGQEQSL